MKFKTELLINKPRAEVWKFFCNREKTNIWQPSLTRIELLSGTAGQPGAESKWIYEERGREFFLTEKVLHSDEPVLFESIFENKFASNTVKNNFIEQGRDGTFWVAETEYNFKTPLMKILGPLFRKNYSHRSQRAMERLKEVVEKE